MLILPVAHGLVASDVWAQQAVAQGIVTDLVTAAPLANANVMLERDGQEVRSVLTDRNGLFQIAGLPAGQYRFRIERFGYGTHEETIDLDGGQRLTINRQLIPDPLYLEALDVVDQGPGAVRRELGAHTILARDLRRIPAPAADLMSYLQTVPGVVGTGDRGGQLFVRGGMPSENMVLMDGMLLYQPFHITGFSSVFPASLVDRAEFLPGGFGPEYSGRVSSVLDVSMRDGHRAERAVEASVSPFLAEVIAEGPLPAEGNQHSYIVSVRRSLIEETSPWLLGEKQPLRFNSQYLKLSTFSRDGGSRCSLTAMRSSDRGGLDPEDEESRVGWSNFLIGGRCHTLTSEVFLDVRFGYSRMSTETITRGASEFSSFASRVFINTDASRTIRRARLNFGGFMNFKEIAYDFLELFSREVEDTGWLETGAYAEAVIPIGDIRLLPGATLSWAMGTFSPAIEPRLRASWRPRGLGDAELSGALGRYGQRLAGMSDQRDASSVFTAWIGPPDELRIKSTHAQMSWQQSLGAGFSWSIDGYYRRMSSLPVGMWSTVATFTPELSLANGRTRGADGRIEYRQGPFYAFGGYSYSRTEYESAQDDFGVWFGEPVVSYHPPHDRRHQANALASLTLGRYTLAARWELGSGFPFTRPFGFDEVFDFRTELPNVRTYGRTRMLVDRPYTGRLPPTHRLDVSLERLVDVRSYQIQLQAGVVNAYGQTNMFYYDIFTDRRIDQLPFAPYLSLRLAPQSRRRP